MFAHIALILDLLLLAFALGATIWFFFVQTPVLLKSMRKEKFLPMQMRLTRALFKALAIAVPLMFATTLIHGADQLWVHVASAGLAMLAALINAFVVVPRALRAGGRALRDERKTKEDDRSTTAFVSHGGGDESKVWHRLVVVFVVVMLGGLIGHGGVLMSHPALGAAHQDHAAVEHVHEHGDETTNDHGAAAESADHAHGKHAEHAEDSYPADASTKKNVAALHSVVRDAHDSTPEEQQRAAGAIRDAYAQIFTDCQMTGEAHEGLHRFLIPLGERIEVLEANPSDSAAELAAMDAHLESFEQRFH